MIGEILEMMICGEQANPMEELIILAPRGLDYPLRVK
jgi:hypothetical protein